MEEQCPKCGYKIPQELIVPHVDYTPWPRCPVCKLIFNVVQTGVDFEEIVNRRI